MNMSSSRIKAPRNNSQREGSISAGSATGVIKLNVGGRLFTTLVSTLTEQSTFFALMLSDRQADNVRLVDGGVFVDADPNLFEHILNFLRRSVPPVFWTRTDGFDYKLYASLLQEAQYFGIPTLEQWISDQKYLDSVKVQHYAESVDLYDSPVFVEWSTDDFEKQFENAPDQVNSGGDGLYKWLFVKRIQFHSPVGHRPS